MARLLTEAQHQRLDMIADDEVGTTVIGWHPLGGPVVRRARDGEPRTDLAAFRYVNAVGHVMPVTRGTLAELAA